MESLLGLLKSMLPIDREGESIIVVEPVVPQFAPSNMEKLGEVKAQNSKIYEIYATPSAIYVFPRHGISPLIATVEGIVERAEKGDREAQKLLPLIGLYPSYIGTKLRIIPLGSRPRTIPVDRLRKLLSRIKTLFIEPLPFLGRLGHGESYRWYIYIHRGRLGDLVHVEFPAVRRGIIPMNGEGIFLSEDQYAKYSNGETSSRRLSRREALTVLRGLVSQSIIGRSSLYSALVNMLQNDAQLRILYGESSPLLEEAVRLLERELEEKNRDKLELARKAFAELFNKSPLLAERYDKYVLEKVKI